MICTEEDVQIGRMVLCPMRQGSGKLWLTWEDSAEGMECEEEKLAAWLERFYRENF